MEQKVVKFEIGKVLAVIITVAVVALVAGVVLQGNYFQGNLGGEEVSDTNPLPAKDFWSGIDKFKIDIEKGQDYDKALDVLKTDFDLLIKDKAIDIDVATKTIDALSVMKDIEVGKTIDAIETYIPAYQKDANFEAFAIEIEKVSIDVVKRDSIIEVSKDIPQFLIQKDNKGIDIELQNWVDSMNKIEPGLIMFDKEMFAKHIEKGIEIDVLAKTFDAFAIEIEKGIDIEVAIEHFIKGSDSVAPGVFIPQF